MIATMPATATRPTRVRYVVLGFLCSLAFLSYLDRVCIARAQVDIQRDLHISDAQIGLVLSIFWLGYALFEIPGGWMGDRFGGRSTLSRIVLAWSLFTALSGAATGYASLLVYRLLFGLGEAGAFPNMARVQSRWFPARLRAWAGGILWLAARWGGAFSFLLFGYLLAGFESQGFKNAVGHVPVLHFLQGVPSWRLGFWSMGFLGLIWTVLFFLWFRDNPADKPSVNEAELELIQSDSGPAPRHEAHGDARVWAALFTSRNLWSLALAYLCISFGWSFFVSWMPRYLLDVHHVSFKGSQAMDVLPMFCGGISCLIGGALSDGLVRLTGWTRFGRAIFPISGYLIAAISMFAIRLTHTPGQAIFLMCLASAANDFGQGACWTTVIGIGGLYAGTAFGFMNMVGNIGNLQPVVGALIFKHFGWNVLFAVYAGVYFCAACLWVGINPTKQFYQAHQRPEGFPVILRH
jgi:MFS family permease